MKPVAAEGISRCVLPAGWEAVMGSVSTGTTTGPPITQCKFTSVSAGHATEAGKRFGVGAEEALGDALDLLYRHQASYRLRRCTLSGKSMCSSCVDALNAHFFWPSLGAPAEPAIRVQLLPA
jgi:hypothetical protein